MNTPIRVITVLASTVALAALAGCTIVDPCDIGRVQTMAGKWDLVLVDGKPIPAAGVPIPLTTERLKSGRLSFVTGLSSVTCPGDDAEDPHSEDRGGEDGEVIGVYQRLNSASQPLPLDAQVGTYGATYATYEVKLKSGPSEVVGRRILDELFFQGNVPLLGQGHTLTFHKVFTR